jgi:hypothetical protein
MSITIQQYAGQLNLANADLLWLVTSNSSSQPQYQFICSLQDGCGNTLTTIKQQPNPSSKGVFNLGRIAKQYIGYDTNMFNMGANSLFYKQTEAARYFKVAFGEEYGVSVSSSASIYNGITNATTGSPAQTGSTAYYYFINGVLDPNSGAWDWNTSSYYSPQPTPSTASFTKNVALTDASRTQYAQPADYLTVGLINGALNGSTSSAQDIYAIGYDVYYTGSLVFTGSEYNLGLGLSASYGGPRTSSAQLWSAVSTVQTCTNNSGSQSSGSFLIYSGIGPANLTANGGYDFATQPWDYYTVKFYAQEGANNINTNGIWDSFTIYKQDPTCGFNGVRFAWINDYGVWDYYNFTLANNKNTTTTRDIYYQNFVDYSTNTNSVGYNKARRGNNIYNLPVDEEYSVVSDWIDTTTADWLAQLFYSPNVYTQVGNEMIPIILTNTNFVAKSNPRAQKLFNYTVTYKLANPKRSR